MEGLHCDADRAIGWYAVVFGFEQSVYCVWRNKELIPKGEDVKLITR